MRKTPEELVLAKPLEDGSLAVGLFSLTKARRTIEVGWADLQLTGEQKARDVWQHKDRGAVSDRYSAAVGPHGVALVKLSPKNGSARQNAR